LEGLEQFRDRDGWRLVWKVKNSLK